MDSLMAGRRLDLSRASSAPEPHRLARIDGAVSSPSHITRRPRTNVPTGQPVTVFPS